MSVGGIGTDDPARAVPISILLDSPDNKKPASQVRSWRRVLG